MEELHANKWENQPLILRTHTMANTQTTQTKDANMT